MSLYDKYHSAHNKNYMYELIKNVIHKEYEVHITYIKSYNEQFEASPMELLAKEGQLMAFKHEGFWHPCDVIRDKQNLDNYWKKNSAPWKKWI